MLPELAQVSLIIAFLLAVFSSVMGLVGVHQQNTQWQAMVKPSVYLQWAFIALAYCILTYSFIVHDFSVAYVASNSNLSQPLLYRVSGVWGAHEGSLLLWILIQATWTALVALCSQHIPKEFVTRVLSVLSLINVGFLSFMLFTSNPFERLLPAPMDGRELNPLLQDPGLAIHPPMLYLGYVGFSVAFAFAVAALLAGSFDSKWAKWTRPWTTVAWLFLTIGITLGSWWAYYELGWGGWWFWDPVENASFMPWLIGTALIHSLAVTEKRGAFVAWTVLLSLSAFSLSLLGTFLVRSGILTSVHAFASDPERGLFILMFLVLVIGGSLTLFAMRGHLIKGGHGFTLFSKETSLLLNNIFLVTTTFMVFVGTLFPLLLEALGKGKISVGAPYFDKMFVVLTLPLALLVGIGALANWKRDQLRRFLSPTVVILSVSLIISSVITMKLSHDGFSVFAFVGLSVAIWVAFWVTYGVWKQGQGRHWKRRLIHPAGIWGMSIAHMGIAVFILGVTHVNSYSIEKDILMAPGVSYDLSQYRVQFEGVQTVREENYVAQEGRFLVSSNQSLEYSSKFELKPQKRLYQSSQNPMTEASINTNPFRDVYISLGEPFDKNDISGSWSVRLYYKSYVMCIWLGGFIMALGGVVAVFDKRYRKAKS